MIIIGKLHRARGKLVLAACDKELLGKRFYEGKHQLDLSSGFYAGEELSEEEFKRYMLECDSLNLVGKQVIGIAQKMGLVERVLKIKGIPYAQGLTLNPVH